MGEGMPGNASASGSRPEPTGLLRPRLLTPLVADDAPGVVVVIAPPGSGKTSLLSRAAALSPRPAAWYAAGPGERAGRDFVRHLAQALTERLGEDHGLPETAAQLTNTLAARPDRPLTLVVDDVHELAGFPAERELADILRRRPRHVRVALGTRRPLGLNTPRLMVSGDLVELDVEALRFRSWEVEELFRVVYGEPLSPEGAAALTRRTGGWAAGLKLFHLATSGRSTVERERAVHDLGGRSRLLRTYLTRTVLDELEPERREFLLTTCTIGTFTASLCDALLERPGSAAVLEDLAERQLFVTIDPSGRHYRFHPVLQTLLEDLLEDELGHLAAVDLYARSASLLESEGLQREALRAYAKAQDLVSVARVLQQSSQRLTVEPMIAQAAEGDDPWPALVGARRLHRAGAFAAAVEGFRAAAALSEEAGFRRRCAEELALAQLWVAGTSVPEDPPRRSTGSYAATRAVREATRRLPAPDQRPRQPFAEGVVLLLAGDLSRAARKLEQAVMAPMPEQLYADLTRVVAEIVDTTGDDTVSSLDQIILRAEEEAQPWVARLARGLQAAVLLVANGEAWRAESCASLVEECERSGDTWGSVLLAGVLGVAQVLRRDPAALSWLDRSTAGASALGAPVLAAWTEHIGAFAARLRSAPDAGARTDRARALAASVRLHGAERLVDTRLGASRRAGSFGRGVMIRCLGPFGIEAAGTEVALPPLRPAATDAPVPAGAQPGAGVAPRGDHRPALARDSPRRGGPPTACGGLQCPAMPRRGRARQRRRAQAGQRLQPARGGSDPRRGHVRGPPQAGGAVRGGG